MGKFVKFSDYELFVKILKEAGEKANLTQVELAQKLGVPQSFVSKYENAKRKVDVLEFIKICRIIDVRPTDIIRRFFNELNV